MSLLKCLCCKQSIPFGLFESKTEPVCQTCLISKYKWQKRKEKKESRPEPPKSKKKKKKTGFDGKSYKSRDKILRKIGFKNYLDYLNSKLWAFIRAKVYETKGRNCLTCGSEASEIHHNDYSIPTMLGKNLDGLVPLCEKCHESIEFKNGEKVKDLGVVEKRYKTSRGAFLDQNKK